MTQACQGKDLVQEKPYYQPAPSHTEDQNRPAAEAEGSWNLLKSCIAGDCM